MTDFEQAYSELLAVIPKASAAVSTRMDGWANAITGMGSAVSDKTSNTYPTLMFRYPDNLLTAMYHSSSLVRTAVGAVVDDALRLGVTVSVSEDHGGVEAATAIQDAMDDLDVIAKFREAGNWERLYGGCVIVMGIDDGAHDAESQLRPLNEAAIKKVHWLRVVDRRRCNPVEGSAIQDYRSPDFGEPEFYQVDTMRDGTQVKVHRSRLLIFKGITTSDDVRQARQGWGISVVELIFESLQRMATAWGSAGNAIANAQYTVLKLKGMANMIGSPEGEEKMRKRARAMEMAKSSINAILLDQEDDYIRENPNFGNMPEMIDRFMLEVSSDCNMPATRLWGQSPAGMNSTGESDDNNWGDVVNDYRRNHVRGLLMRLIGILLASREGPTKGKVPDEWSIAFPPLEEMDDNERADIRLKTAQADHIYVEDEVLVPEEVATSRFRPEGFSTETQVDLELRESMKEERLKQVEENIKNPPPPPVVTPGVPGALEVVDE